MAKRKTAPSDPPRYRAIGGPLNGIDLKFPELEHQDTLPEEIPVAGGVYRPERREYELRRTDPITRKREPITVPFTVYVWEAAE